MVRRLLGFAIVTAMAISCSSPAPKDEVFVHKAIKPGQVDWTMTLQPDGAWTGDIDMKESKGTFVKTGTRIAFTVLEQSGAKLEKPHTFQATLNGSALRVGSEKSYIEFIRLP